MDYKKSVDEYFPTNSYREYQKETIEKAREYFRDGKKVVVIESPTGSGKSIVDMTLARMCDKAIYTSPLVNLIDQISNDDLLENYHKRVYGRRNYECLLSRRKKVGGGMFKVQDCKDAICQRDDKFLYDESECVTIKEAKQVGVEDGQCLYVKELMDAINSQIASMTFGYFLVNPHFDWSNWEMLVIDEAHDIASQFVSFASVNLNRRFTPFWDELVIPDFSKWKDWKRWLKTTVRSKAELKKASFGSVLTEDEKKVSDKCDSIIRKIDMIEMTDSIYVVDKMKNAIKFTPVDISNYMKKYIWDYFDKVLISSATFSDIDMEDLGLDDYNYKRIEVLHTFSDKNRPVFYYPVGKMSRSHRDETIPKLCGVIEEIIEKESGNKGIIHCHSYDIQSEIMKYFNDKNKFQRKLISHTSRTREKKLEEWKESKYGVFVSVGMENGLDLKDDLARFNIIAKVPWADMGDSYVKKRLKGLGHEDWYHYSALKRIIQGSGRIVRSKDDFGRTYVLDASFRYLYRSIEQYVPDWFDRVVEQIKSLEEVYGEK